MVFPILGLNSWAQWFSRILWTLAKSLLRVTLCSKIAAINESLLWRVNHVRSGFRASNHGEGSADILSKIRVRISHTWEIAIWGNVRVSAFPSWSFPSAFSSSSSSSSSSSLIVLLYYLALFLSCFSMSLMASAIVACAAKIMHIERWMTLYISSLLFDSLSICRKYSCINLNMYVLSSSSSSIPILV